jgi:putative Holliday junction resolvase
LNELAELVRAEDVDRVVVGVPLTLRGERGEQARETERFAAALEAILEVPVDRFDERFTTTLAGPGSGDDARAAAHLLASYLEWSRTRR